MTMRDRLADDLHNEVLGCKWTEAEEYEACPGPECHYGIAGHLIALGWVRLDEAQTEEIAVRLWKVIADHDCTVDASHVLTVIRALQEEADGNLS